MNDGHNRFTIQRSADKSLSRLMAVRIHSLLFLCLMVFANAVAWARPDESTVRKNREAADAFFTNGAILRLQIEIAEADVESLRKEPRKYVKAVIRDGDMVYTNVNLHLKGSIGSFRPIDNKPGMTINLKPGDSGASFHGLKKFHLNNCMQDGSYMSEWICGEIFRAGGVPATRASHALVELNGRKLGLYVLLESMNKDFLSRYFTNTDGNLYGQSKNADITEALERMEGKGENSRADLQALAAAAQEQDPARLHDRLQSVLDIDAFLSFMAMEVMLCHWDGYTFATHNFRVYHDPAKNKIHFLPHDFDQMIMEPNSPIHPGARGIIARDILKIPATRARYRERLGTLHTNAFVAPTLIRRIDDELAKIMPVLTSYDPALARSIKSKCDDLKDRIAQRAQAVEEQLKLPPPENLVLQVNVMDAETQMLVPRCTVIPGFYDGGRKLSWDRTHVYRALRGAFVLDVAEARMSRIPAFFKFEAEGYLPSVVSYRLSTNAEDAVFTIELKKGSRLTGSVTAPDGTTARGAEVVLLTESANPVLSQSQFIRQPGLPIVRVLDRGRFSFAPDAEACAVGIAHDEGFIESSLEEIRAKPQIALRPWGCIEGVLTQHEKEPSPLKVALTTELSIPKLFDGLYSGIIRLDSDDYSMDLSPNRSFIFTNVPPGEIYVWRIESPMKSTNTSTAIPLCSGRRLSIKPGETNLIVWGANECAIEGRISRNEPALAIGSKSETKSMGKRTNPFLLGVLKLTPKGGEPQHSKECFFNLDESNRFRVFSSESGAFEAVLRLYSPPALLGIMRREIVLPPQPDKSAFRSFDFGLVELKPLKPAQTGEPAPPFRVVDLDGAPFSLADFRGKYVLLHFWASWCTPQFTILPNLKEIWNEHQNDSRFVMIGLSLDPNPGTALGYTRRNDMPWKQGFLGEWFQTSLPSEYGATAIPFAVLVGPDGSILSKDTVFTSLPATIKKALQKN